MKILIICGGAPPSEELFFHEFKNCDSAIAVDGGGDVFYKYKILPQILLGDLDSISCDGLKFMKENNVPIEEFNPEKDSTDGELGVLKAKEMGGKKIILLGCTGNRIDHLLGNLGLLKKANSLGIEAELLDENNKIFLVDRPVTVKKHENCRFSVYGFSSLVENLSIKGAKYELENYTLNLGDSRTISNEFKDEKVEIKFTEGELLIIITKKS